MEAQLASLVLDLRKGGLEEAAASSLAGDVSKVLSSEISDSLKWQKISKQLLTPEIPFAVHQYLFKKTYTDSNDPNYIWIPTQSEIESTNLHKFVLSQKHKDMYETFEWAKCNREEFWGTITQLLDLKFHSKPENFRTFDLSKGGSETPVYYPDCTMNAVDTLLAGDENRIAIVWSKEGNDTLNEISLRQLRMESSRIADALTNKCGLKVGDAVAIDMPMNWQSVAIYLAILKAGMVVVSIADSFAPSAIAIRLKIAHTKLIFTQDIIPRGAKKIPLYSRVLEAGAPTTVVLPADDSGKLAVDELRNGDLSWDDFLSGAKDTFDSVAVDSMAFANILFSSGTTGEPKAIPWHHSTFIKPLSDGYLHNDVRKNEVVAWPTNIGWMMGPWLISQLGLQSTIALFVGSPVGREFCQFVANAKVAHLGVIPSMVKSWMRSDAVKGLDWSNVRRFSSTGEASNPVLYHWLVSRAHYSPVMEYVGGTEIAGGYLCGTMVQPQLLSSFSSPAFGMDIVVLDQDTGERLKEGEGELTIVPPSMGLSTTLLNKDHYQVYYEAMSVSPDNKDTKLRRHGDQLRILKNGYYQHLGRCDDTMNLGGIKISSVALENVVIQHPLLSRECAAIAYRKEAIDTEKLVICVVPKNANDTFEVIFENKPLGLQLAPTKDVNDSRTLVYDVTDTTLSQKYPNLKSSVLYKINNIVVTNYKLSDTVALIQKCETPLTLQFLKSSFDVSKVKNELQILVKKKLNPLFRVHDLFIVTSLPRTASGKVMRRVLRTVYSTAAQ